MFTPHRWMRVRLVLLGLGSCGRLTPSQLQGTATVLGGWSYGSPQPNPTTTMVVPPRPRPATGTPTAISTTTPTPAGSRGRPSSC